MYSPEQCDFSFWRIVPIIMMLLCFFMMRGRRGSMMCGFGSHAIDGHQIKDPNSAKDILDRRYATGEINKEEYVEIKRTLAESTDTING